LILILAGEKNLTRKAISELRLEMGKRLGLRNAATLKPLWVTDFPLFEYDAEAQRFIACHHPFTSPKPEHLGMDERRIEVCRYQSQCVRFGN
jgi:aspartyl-tRNA synthetase